MKHTRLALCGVLTAAALTIFVLEAQLPPILPVPGIKPGLSNLITLFALLYLSTKETFLILLARILLGGLLIAAPSTLLYSLSGGLLCLVTELILFRFCYRIPIWAVSAIGAMVHNLGQLFLAALVTGTLAVLWYLPFLLISGIVTGLFTGFCIHIFHNRSGNRMRRFLS